MKILYLIPALYNPGGMERILTEKVNCLVQNYNHIVTIITTEQRGRKVYFSLDSRIKVLDFEINFDLHSNHNIITKYFQHNAKIKSYKKK